MKKVDFLMIIVLIAICCSILFVKKAIEPSETESVSYDINEELTSIEIVYGGRPEWDNLVINFETKTLYYSSSSYSIEDKIYELKNVDAIYLFFKEHILYGNWNGDMIDPPSYVTVFPPGEEVGKILWGIYVETSKGEHNFADFEKLPSFWYELIELLCEGTGAKSEDFGIVVE